MSEINSKTVTVEINVTTEGVRVFIKPGGQQPILESDNISTKADLESELDQLRGMLSYGTALAEHIEPKLNIALEEWRKVYKPQRTDDTLLEGMTPIPTMITSLSVSKIRIPHAANQNPAYKTNH